MIRSFKQIMYLFIIRLKRCITDRNNNTVSLDVFFYLPVEFGNHLIPGIISFPKQNNYKLITTGPVN